MVCFPSLFAIILRSLQDYIVLTVSNIIPILTCRVCSVKTSQLIITSCGHLFCHR
ncbi:hypothetical protein BC629DRAFT_1456122 [Irpex lacteus]|nr:hypothetical protein BC629DRAFT_1456122 [Irpex lacteus]